MAKRKKTRAQELKEVEQDKQRQLKSKLIKLRLAAVGIKLPDPGERRDIIMNSKKTKGFEEMATTAPREQNQRRVQQEADNINTNKKIKPTGTDSKMTLGLKKKFAKAFKQKSLKNMGKALDSQFIKFLKDDQNKAIKKKLAKIKQASIDYEHGHTIIFKGHPKGLYRAASLESQQGHYVKYWLLNAKQTNGNGWGIAAHSAKTNMHKFIGRPLVVTSAKWRGSKKVDKYGDTFDHPYIPTNDLNQIFAHQEQYRVGNIVDIGEKEGDYYAMIKMLPKYANMTLPPFCSPAIYQLDAREAEGQISKWEALHLAALDTDPAYGARIAILRGTCVGSDHECRVQFKSAKQVKTTTDPDKFNQSGFQSPWVERHNKRTEIAEEDEFQRNRKVSKLKRKLARVTKGNTTFDTKKGSNIVDIEDIEANIKPLPGTAKRPKKEKKRGQGIEKFFGAAITCPVKLKEKFANVFKGYNGDSPVKKKLKKKLKAAKQRLASLGEQNMTFQKSKKIKIHKRKHPEVRKARTNAIDFLRKQGRSVDGSQHRSTFLTQEGEFIGGSKDPSHSHVRQILNITGKGDTANNLADNGDQLMDDFLQETGLLRIQRFRINREGEERTSVDARGMVSRSQIKAIQDLEKGGRTIGFVAGDLQDPAIGDGSKDFIHALRQQKMLSGRLK